MAKRVRTCPTTGVPLKDVDDACLRADGREVDVDWLREQFPDCNLYSAKQAALTIFPYAPWPAGVRQFKHRLGLEVGATQTSYYHLHQVCLLGVDGSGPTLYLTHASSLAAGSNSYTADAIARCTRDQSGLRRGAVK